MSGLLFVATTLLPFSVSAADPRSWWAFQSLGDPLPPSIHDPRAAPNPIDAFILARLSSDGLAPAPRADRRTLIRRASFDLTGLPPSMEEVEAFLADASPDAFARAVERLLASPRYGERWGRHWLDVARYSDTAGDNADYPVPEARMYRDWVIDSFNADKPYDQFVREQLAGDILASRGPRARYAEQLVATGFLALSRRYGTGPYEFWHLTLEDTIETVGQAFLGLSLRCARCHDHKFDPVLMRDYYALYGIFESTRFPWAGGEEFESKKFGRRDFPLLVPDSEAAPLLALQAARIQEAKEAIAGAEREPTSKARDETLGRLRAELRDLERSGLPHGSTGAYAVREGSVHNVAVQLRGEPAQPGPVVPRGAIEAFLGSVAFQIQDGASGREELAAWLTRPDHPLTVRVMANRIWQHHFGRGLVATPSNFGTRGAPPSHPELLDWLAARFIESGWSVKAMHRLILASHTWQQAADGDAANAQKDPGNTLVWRQNRRRLDAEAIRDAVMLASGRLDLSLPALHPFPPITSWHWTQHNQFKAVYATRHRSCYLMTQRLQRHPFLALFDGPDTNSSTAERSSATVPTQALYLLNSPELLEEARAFAQRVLGMAQGRAERIGAAYAIAFQRAPRTEEVARAGEFLDRAFPRQAGDSETWTRFVRTLLASNEFFYLE